MDLGAARVPWSHMDSGAEICWLSHLAMFGFLDLRVLGWLVKSFERHGRQLECPNDYFAPFEGERWRAVGTIGFSRRAICSAKGRRYTRQDIV
jgi:hypothetical protein